jgi:hypothetical protein
MWRTVGFLMSFAVVIEGIAIVAYLVILSGGKQLRESGWAVLSLIIVLSAMAQAASMALVVSFFSSRVQARIAQSFLVVKLISRRRPTYLIMMTDSLWAGFWTRRG